MWLTHEFRASGLSHARVLDLLKLGPVASARAGGVSLWDLEDVGKQSGRLRVEVVGTLKPAKCLDRTAQVIRPLFPERKFFTLL